MKMTDMVRKHTVEGTGNWRAICDIIDRTKEMLYAAKSTARTFVPPADHRDQVPLGSSSASMYPGYSPADHEYGKAAEEYGSFAAAARARGVDVKHPDLEYEIGQARGTKRKVLEGIEETTNVKHGGPGSRGAGEAPGGPETKPMTPYALHLKKQAEEKNAAEETTSNGDNPSFVIDVNPTPVNLARQTTKSPKRSASPPAPLEQKKAKKAKKKHKGDLPQATDYQGVEFEDISQEVDARMKEKEAKRKRKEEKKRKRESADSPTAPADSSADAEVERPKKRKSKKSEDNALSDGSISKKRHGGEDDEEQGEVKKKKRKKSKDQVEA